ncbi:MAG: hypothetical protein E6X23_08430 [Mixta calida]|nr:MULTISPECIES: hypothetical protein [Mixta]MBS6056702.1 hypothetical protein [Pantoea sp.]KAF0860855.1 hypothetical protein Y888_04965 [Mixta calida B021323]MCR1565740.1 hypothetical protein [Mixta sp.]MDU3076448.1 hypothetical protein [Mixta calida]MDU3815392.1 hypothetical protein [Pantoea sp.]
MPDLFSASKRRGLSLLACSALARAFAVALLLAALWIAIRWAEMLP